MTVCHESSSATRFTPESDGLGHSVSGARALQLVKSKAKEWNIDKNRIGASGESAGGCSSPWLAFHDDLADPLNRDPIKRESTRIFCAAVSRAQTSLDPKQLREWTPNSRYGGHAFGFPPNPDENKTRDTDFTSFLANRESLLPWIKEYSPFKLVSAGDSAVYLAYSEAPDLGKEQKDTAHTANYGVQLQKKCRFLGVECEFYYPNAPDASHKSITQFLIQTLKAK